MGVKLKIFLIALLICVVGVLSIYSSTYQKEGKLWQEIYQRQIFWILLGFLLFLLTSNFNYRSLWGWTYFLYGLAIFLLFLVVILGIARLGAQRWLKIVWFNFQPSEIVKLIMVIFLARYFSLKSADNVSLKVNRFGIFKGLIIPFVFMIIPVGLIIEQPDLGSGAIIMFLFILMLYLGKVKLKYILIFFAVILLLMPISWNFLRDYQKDRIMVFLNPNIDPLGAGYTIIQSKIAIGSGGILGKGWLSGTQSQLHFLPESHTDFIFATFTEEWGFFGGFMLMLLYYFLIRQGIYIAEHTHDHFGKLLAWGISMLLAVEVVVNLAMNMGFAPVVGLPLPLMSYGGSSVCVTFIALGILVNINKRRAVF